MKWTTCVTTCAATWQQPQWKLLESTSLFYSVFAICYASIFGDDLYNLLINRIMYIILNLRAVVSVAGSD
jgi:hypothetical protein